MNFMTQLGVLIIILLILMILIKSNQTLEKIYMEDEQEREKIERPVERSMNTIPVDTFSKWSIDVLDDRGRVIKKHRITSYPCKIGRNEDNDLVLDDLSVSSFHAKVEDMYGVLELVDQGSLNKLLVNGHIETAVEIMSGMEVDLGNTRLCFRKEEEKSNPTISYRGNSLMEEWH